MSEIVAEKKSCRGQLFIANFIFQTVLVFNSIRVLQAHVTIFQCFFAY